MPLQPQGNELLPDEEKQRLSLLAARISFAIGISFGLTFTTLGLYGLFLYAKLIFAPNPFHLGYDLGANWVTGKTIGLIFALSIVSLGFGAPVLWSTLKQNRLSKTYLLPLFVFCAAVQARILRTTRRQYRLR